MAEKLSTLNEVIENTKKGIIELSKNDPDFKVELFDFSYITQELIDNYRENAKPKDMQQVYQRMAEASLEAIAMDACYCGNRWALIDGPIWYYTNNYSGNDCDPITTECLCGNGYSWRVKVRTFTWARISCSNRPMTKLAWPPIMKS